MPLPDKQFSATVTILLAAVVLLTAGAALAQGPLDVARARMLAGHTGEARRIVAAELSAGGSEAARLINAVLAAPADSAASLLEQFARHSGRGPNTGQAAERMGDLLFSARRWENAVEWWEFALKNLTATPAVQRVTIKSARAELERGRAKQALSKLESALAAEETPLTGEARFWQAMALERRGKTREAAEAYLAAYTTAGNRLSLAALYRLNNFYGSAGGRNAADWRTRWQNASAGTVFASRYLPAAAAPGSATHAGWTVQLGAFSSGKRAAAHASRIRKLGLSPVIEQPRGDKLYRVHLEGIASEKELKRITAKLKKNKLEYHVIKPGK